METPRCLFNKHASTGASPVVSDEMRQLLNWRDGLVFVPQRITLHRRKHSFAGGIQMKSRGVAVLVTLAMIAAIGCGISSSSNPAAPETSVLTASDTFSSGVVGEPVAPATEPFEGYSLIAPLRSSETYLVDMTRQIVHQWSAKTTPGSAVYLLENGDLLRGARDPDHSHFRGGGIGASIQRFGWDGQLLWDFTYANESHCLHHDIEPLPNGNILMIAWEKKSKEEAIAQGRAPELLSDDGLWPDHIIEVRPNGPTGGEIVWQWHMWDHLVQDFDREKPNYGVIYEHPDLIDLNNTGSTPPETPEELRRLRSLGYTGGGEDDSADEGSGRNRRGRADWLHTNAINYNPELDQIALSAKNFSEIWIIDHSTTTEEAASHKGGKSGKGGDLLYRWGNPWAYKSGTIANKKLFDQHDVRWIPRGHPGAGHLMAFNNGPGREYSSIIEIQAPMNADGEYILNDDGTYGPEELAWEYTADPQTDFYSGHISGATRMPNGNTLICNGEKGCFFEVNSERKTLWEFTQPYGGELDRGGRRNDPIELARKALQENGDGGAGGLVEEGTALFRAIKYALDFPPFLENSIEPLDPQPVPFATIVSAGFERLKSEQPEAGEVTADEAN
jgi:hypothetical protein